MNVSMSARLNDKTIYLDDLPKEGARVEVREDFDDPDSAVIGIFTLTKKPEGWVLV